MNIFITEDISQQVVNRVLNDILINQRSRKLSDEKEDKKEIVVYLNSKGGDIEAGYSLYEILKLSGYKIITFAISEVYSSAVMVYLAGDERFATNYSCFMIHEPYHDYSNDDKDPMSISDYRKNLKELQLSRNEYFKLICKHTSFTQQRLKNFCNNGRSWYLRTPEAKKWGLVTKVGTPFSII